MSGAIWTRREYDRASKALDAAHKACFKHPDRGPVGMSHRPFSGVNEALGIIAELEQFKDEIEAKFDAGYRLLGPDELDPVTIEWCAGLAEQQIGVTDYDLESEEAVAEAVTASRLAAVIHSFTTKI